MTRKELLSSTSHALPSMKIAFPEGTYFIRPLKQEDETAVTQFLENCGATRNEADVAYGIFDEDHKIVDLYRESGTAFATSKNSGQSLIWMQ